MKATASLLAFAALAGAISAQNLVLPDNHHLMERADQLANSGDTTYWRTTAGRFQIIYEASNFTGKSGVLGPVVVTHVKFRGEDGEPNLGGQVYTGVTVEIGTTSLTSATMSTTFATNRLPATTTMGPLGTATVTVAPSVGTCPNNYCIDIDLAAIGALFTIDPTGPQPNLLIDINMPTAPANAAPLYLIPIQDTTAHGAGIRGKAVTTGTVGALTGTADTTPAVVGLEIAGPGGYANIVPARNEEYGAACGGACSTFYQTFNQGQAFDITGLTLVPSTLGGYTVLGGAPPPDLTKLNATPNSVADEALVTQALGFTWTYPGGSTTTIKPSTNGHIWLDSTMTAAMYQTNKADMLGAGATNYTARYMPFWADLHCGRNTASNPAAGLHVVVVPETSPGAGDAVVYTTWNDVGLYRVGSSTTTQPGHSSYTFQCVMYQLTGIVEYRYGPMMTYASSLWTTSTSMYYSSIVGFTRGRISTTPLIPSQDPQNRDLSIEVPFDTAPEGTTGNAGLYAVAAGIPGGVGYMGRMFGTQSMTWNLSNIPSGTIFAMTVLDLGATQPGFQFPGITAPGCMISTTLNPVFLPWELFILPGTTATGINALPIPHGWEGTDITVQGMGLDLSGTPGAPLIPWSTQAIRHTAGLD